MHQVNCLVDDAVMQMLDRCKELLSNKHPCGIDYNTLLMELASHWLERGTVKRYRRSESKWDLEIHNDGTPFAMGGGHSLRNLRLLCAVHNKLESERVYGRWHMEKYFKQQE